MTTILDGAAAIADMRANPVNVPGFCLARVSAAYNAPRAITPAGGGYENAIDGWTYSAYRHPGDFDVPAGYPAYFGASPTRTDANASAGDIVLSIGHGMALCTDAVIDGKIGVLSLQDRAIKAGRPFLGWTDDFCGFRINSTGTPFSPPILTLTNESDTDMKFYFYLDANHPFYERTGASSRLIKTSEWNMIRGAYRAIGENVPLAKVSRADYIALGGVA